MLEFIALGMLTCEPLTGYDIKKAIESGIGIFYKASYGSLYPMLKKMTEKELLTVYDQPQGNRQKKYYQITEIGRSAFFTWLKAPINFDDSTDQQLSKIFFFDKLPKNEQMQQLSNYEQDCTAFLHKLYNMQKEYIKLDLGYYKLSTLYYGISTVQTTLEWIRHIKNQDELSAMIDEKL